MVPKERGFPVRLRACPIRAAEKVGTEFVKKGSYQFSKGSFEGIMETKTGVVPVDITEGVAKLAQTVNTCVQGVLFEAEKQCNAR